MLQKDLLSSTIVRGKRIRGIISMFTPFYRALPITIQEDNGESKDYFCLADERGNVYSKEDVLQLFEQVKAFYEREDSPVLVAENNDAKRLEDTLRTLWGIEFTQNEYGKYLLPTAKYKYKVFKTDKKHWSITCGWCGEKVSSKVEEGYYSLHNGNFDINFERACSEDCAQLIWKEGFKNWLHENGFQKYFDC